MGTQKKNNLKKIISNSYFINILLMLVTFVVIVWGIFSYLNIYTRHNDTLEIPNLKGLQVQDAIALTASKDLKCEVVDSIYHEDGTPGAILEQVPKETSKVKRGRTIYLTVQSKNEPLATAPDLEDISFRQAETMLKSAGFTSITVKYVPSEFEGLVVGFEYKGRQVIAGQQLPKGAALTLKVGDGSGAEQDSTTQEAN